MIFLIFRLILVIYLIWRKAALKIKKNDILEYLVEGKTEQKLILQIKEEHIHSGKVTVLNLLQERNIDTWLRKAKQKTVVAIVFDTDVTDKKSLEKLHQNIEKIKKAKHIKKVVIIPQIHNFEDEIIFSTDINKISDFTKSKSDKDFKADFLKMSNENIPRKLKDHKFNIAKFWSRNAMNQYRVFNNESEYIKR